MDVGLPEATSALIVDACAGVRLLKVRAIVLSPGITGIVAEPVSPWATLLVKKPDSFRRRCSKAKKKNVRFVSKGPPKVNPYCVRVNGGSSIGAKALRAWKLRCRKNPNMLPWNSFVPDLVTTFTTPPAERPNSGANEFVT